MSNSKYPACEALDPCFEVMMKGLSNHVDGEHYFDTLADDVVFEFQYEFPGWPRVTRGRDALISLYSGYGRNIRLDRGDALLVHPSDDGRVVTLEYEVHGKVLASDVPYDNRFVSIATIENRKIVRWRDYMDSLAAWTALSKSG
ncbi:MAG: nuclear transport factor 2 family protein [Bradyrhizobium sp.]